MQDTTVAVHSKTDPNCGEVHLIGGVSIFAPAVSLKKTFWHGLPNAKLVVPFRDRVDDEPGSLIRRQFSQESSSQSFVISVLADLETSENFTAPVLKVFRLYFRASLSYVRIDNFDDHPSKFQPWCIEKAVASFFRKYRWHR